MQWSPPLILLLCAAAAVGLNCHLKTRYGPTVDSLQNDSWGNVSHNTTYDYPYQNLYCSSPSRGWTACARWLIDRGTAHYKRWQDYYGGCYDSSRGANGQLVRKYCADSNVSSCTSTQFVQSRHQPAILCCCHNDSCDTEDIYAYAEQKLATTTTPKPPLGPKQKVSCERSMRTAATRNRLSRAEPTRQPDEQCEAEWAPCVEFLYKNPADDQWRQWRAGCSYQHGGVNYKDIVEQFCSASYKCGKFDMLDPASRATGWWNFTRAYACCCDGTGCQMPDTVAFSKGFVLTPPPPTTTAPAEVADGDEGGSRWWLWLLLVVFVVLLVASVAIVAAIVIILRRNKRKPAEKQRNEEAEGVEPVEPPSADRYMLTTASSGAAPTMGDTSGSSASSSGI